MTVDREREIAGLNVVTYDSGCGNPKLRRIISAMVDLLDLLSERHDAIS